MKTRLLFRGEFFKEQEWLSGPSVGMRWKENLSSVLLPPAAAFQETTTRLSDVAHD